MGRDMVTLYQILFECNQIIRGGVIAISIFDLITLNMCHVLRSILG